MSMKAKFETFIHDLDHDALQELSRSVASEVEGRSRKPAFKFEDIHPQMTAAEKEQAMNAIHRVLRGED
jgi:hypothetical protein